MQRNHLNQDNNLIKNKLRKSIKNFPSRGSRVRVPLAAQSENQAVTNRVAAFFRGIKLIYMTILWVICSYFVLSQCKYNANNIWLK